jgi:hypothetical protein
MTDDEEDEEEEETSRFLVVVVAPSLLLLPSSSSSVFLDRTNTVNGTIRNVVGGAKGAGECCK